MWIIHLEVEQLKWNDDKNELKNKKIEISIHLSYLHIILDRYHSRKTKQKKKIINKNLKRIFTRIDNWVSPRSLREFNVWIALIKIERRWRNVV